MTPQEEVRLRILKVLEKRPEITQRGHAKALRLTAEVPCGEETILLTRNQSTYIPLGETHRLVNPATIPLEIINVRSGNYLAEDDIVRYEDSYGRST